MAALDFVIRARDEATKTIDKVRGKVHIFEGQINKTIKSLFSLQSAAIAAAAAVAAAFASRFIKAAESIEIFRMQLNMVTGSAEAADQALSAIREFARTSPLETEDVVKAYVRLRAVGIDPTMKQMKTLGGIALMMHKPMEDMVDAFVGYNKKTLRSMGIEIDRTGRKAILQSGGIRKEVEKDSGSIRQALLEIWEERFPNAIERASGTFSAQVEIMKSNVFEFSVAIGEIFLPEITKIVIKLGGVFEWFLSHINYVKGFIYTLIAEWRTLWNVITIAVRTLMTGFVGIGMMIFTVGRNVVDAFGLMISAAKRFGTAVWAITKGKWNVLENLKESFAGFGAEFSKMGENVQSGYDAVERLSGVAAQQTKKDLNDIANAWKKVSDVVAEKPLGFGGELPGTGNLGAGGEDDGDASRAELKALKDRIKYLKDAEEAYMHLRDVALKASVPNREGFDEQNARELQALENHYTDMLAKYQGNEDAISAIKRAAEIERTDMIIEQERKRVAFATDSASKLVDVGLRLNEQTLIMATKNAQEQQRISIVTGIIQANAAAGFAIAKAWQSSSSWQEGLIASIIAGGEALATSLSYVSQMKSQSFASGGVTPGGPAMLHPNEVILNPKQQAELLFNMASGCSGGSRGGTYSPSVSITIAGSADGNTVRQLEEMIPRALQRAYRSGSMRDVMTDMGIR